jgi:hypothetical protein
MMKMTLLAWFGLGRSDLASPNPFTTTVRASERPLRRLPLAVGSPSSSHVGLHLPGRESQPSS